MLSLLPEGGAIVEAETSNLWTPMEFAALNGHLRMCMILGLYAVRPLVSTSGWQLGLLPLLAAVVCLLLTRRSADQCHHPRSAWLGSKR